MFNLQFNSLETSEDNMITVIVFHLYIFTVNYIFIFSTFSEQN